MSCNKNLRLKLPRKAHFAVYCSIFILILICCSSISIAKTDVPVFLLSGQSDMTGYAEASALSAHLQNYSFNTADMANGFYAVKVSNGTEVYKTRFILNNR